MRLRCAQTLAATLLYLLLSLHSITAMADRAVDVSQPSIQLGSWSRVIRDADASLSAEQIFSQPQRYPGVKGSAITSFYFTDDAYWFVVPLYNPLHNPLTRLLVFEPIWLDDLQVTLLSNSGLHEQFHGGDYLPFSDRSLSHRKVNFSLQLPPGHSQLFVRVKTVDPFVVNMTLWETTAFYESDSLETAYLGLVYGVLGAMLLYNLVLFIAIRETVYAAYVAYVFFFMTWHIINNGITYQHLWPESPGIANWSQSISLYMIMVAGLYFAINFLQLPQRMPRTYHWAAALFAALILSFLFTTLGGYQLHVTSGVLWVIAYTPVLIVFGILALMAGNRAARYFVPATTAGFLGSGITALAVSGLIPFNTYTYRAVDFGMLIDAILLSIALADRLKLARADTERARAELFEATRFHAQQLEEEVEQRTMELREANAAKDKFFSIIAHDLRGPLSSLSLFYNDIIKSPKDFTDEILMLTRDTTNNTRDLLEQLLTWARSQRGEIDYNPRPTDLRLLLAEIEDFFSAQARAKDIQLQMNVDAPCWVYADRAMVHTVLRNLIGNALKYTKAGGLVGFNLIKMDNAYQLRITDSGIGMSDQALQQLFQPDTKPQSVPGTLNETGTGLGLILCNEFVQRNGGTLGAESEPGKGSTFWFTLPRTNPVASADSPVAIPAHRPLHILIADDKAISRETSARFLHELDHTVSFASNGIEAVTLANKNDFDLILMDINMPLLNGIEATRQIRTNDRHPPIIAFSSYFKSEIEQLAGDVKFDGYVNKPLSRESIVMEIERLFNTVEPSV